MPHVESSLVPMQAMKNKVSERLASEKMSNQLTPKISPPYSSEIISP